MPALIYHKLQMTAINFRNIPQYRTQLRMGERERKRTQDCVCDREEGRENTTTKRSMYLRKKMDKIEYHTTFP